MIKYLAREKPELLERAGALVESCLANHDTQGDHIMRVLERLLATRCAKDRVEIVVPRAKAAGSQESAMTGAPPWSATIAWRAASAHPAGCADAA